MISSPSKAPLCDDFIFFRIAKVQGPASFSGFHGNPATSNGKQENVEESHGTRGFLGLEAAPALDALCENEADMQGHVTDETPGVKNAGGGHAISENNIET